MVALIGVRLRLTVKQGSPESQTERRIVSSNLKRTTWTETQKKGWSVLDVLTTLVSYSRILDQESLLFIESPKDFGLVTIATTAATATVTTSAAATATAASATTAAAAVTASATAATAAATAFTRTSLVNNDLATVKVRTV
jgi:hypothetical protein